MTNLDILKSRDISLPTNKDLSCQSYGFASSHVWMWDLDYKESWVLKNWCFWTVVLEKTPVSPLDCKEIKLVNLKENQSWIFIGRTDAETEAPILWAPDAKNWLTGKDPDAWKDWRQEKKGMTEMRCLDGITDSMDMSLSKLWRLVNGQGSLACCSPWGLKELDMTDWTEQIFTSFTLTFWLHKHEKYYAMKLQKIDFSNWRTFNNLY